jgi:glycosyltransferase involved in cell wall biosynthesis
MKEPVTLLIPNYNGARFLRETIPALLNQTFRDFQLIVVDNCSTDDSAAFVRSFADPRLRLALHEEHLPVCANFKRAWAMVETPYFATCACDEVYEPKWLEAMVGLLESRPDAFFACCKADSADENGKPYLAHQERYKATFWPREEPAVFTRDKHVVEFLHGDFLIITTGVFRTSAAEAIGPLNEQSTFAGDWEYWVRGLLAGFTIIGTHRRLVHYRRHADMTTRKLNTNLSRFRDELDMVRWIAQAAFQAGLLNSPETDCHVVRNTLLDDFAGRLAARDFEGADQLLSFGVENIPHFRGSVFHRLAQAARMLRRPGGLALQAAEWAALRLRSLARG